MSRMSEGRKAIAVFQAARQALSSGQSQRLAQLWGARSWFLLFLACLVKSKYCRDTSCGFSQDKRLYFILNLKS